LDNNLREKIEHEIYRIEKLLNDSKPLLDLCKTKEQMEKYMYFRHFIRHSYSSELKWSEMETLARNLEEIWIIIKTDFESFIKNN
jgi:hypothetical protein